MARHSTGCRNCVRRRVRCDKRQPHCKNCEKRKLICGGSQEGHFFVNQHLDKHQHVARKTSSPPTDNSSSPTAHPSPSPFSCWSKYCTDVQICYLQDTWDLNDQAWISYCTSDQSRYPVAFLALRALAGVYFGRRICEPSIVIQGTNLYGRALTALQNALQEGDRLDTFDLLTASTALQRYEAIVCTTGTGWIEHSGGIAKAIELSGPDCFHEYPNKAILDANRYRIIQEAYHHRRRTFLADDEWRTVKSYDGSQEAHYAQLQDLYARLAGLSEDVISCLEEPQMAQDFIQEVSDEADGLLADLDCWMIYWTWEFGFTPHERFDTDITGSIYAGEAGPIFNSSLHYPTRQAAIGVNIYRILKLTVLEWRYILHKPTWCASDNREGMGDIPMAQELAIDTCRTLHSHFINGRLGQGMHDVYSLLFCVRVAYKAFPCVSPEAKWIVAFLSKVADRTGVELARGLTAQMWSKRRSRGRSSKRIIST